MKALLYSVNKIDNEDELIHSIKEYLEVFGFYIDEVDIATDKNYNDIINSYVSIFILDDVFFDISRKTINENYNNLFFIKKSNDEISIESFIDIDIELLNAHKYFMNLINEKELLKSNRVIVKALAVIIKNIRNLIRW